ncbi:MOB kinase activator 1B isoform X1 [Grus americana]|uniref:MOB kinase activator 1B isoform X1 n=1 Tax=Grus americana TaxID=9117 RepID=UPI002407F3E6|nr:MOB kinase activator 1B isoform X1 [Grus americana]
MAQFLDDSTLASLEFSSWNVLCLLSCAAKAGYFSSGPKRFVSLRALSELAPQFGLKRDEYCQAAPLLKHFSWFPCDICGSRSSKTFKPKKNIPEGSHQYELLKHAEATLGSGNLRMAVMLPEGEDLNEWVAVNTVDFFNQINMLYGTITDFCTEESCPVMSAGPKYEYHWADGTNIKKPIKCSAPKYIDYLMTWVQDQLDDETLFPSKIGVPFPKNFMSVAKTILKRLFRVYAHIYHQHFDPVIQLQEEAHLNTSFKHFIFFVQEFNLIDRRELAPLQELIEKLTSKDR